MEVIQQTPALTHHYEQTTPRAVIFQVLLEVLGQMVDPLREQRDLHVRGTGVLGVRLELVNGLFQLVSQIVSDFSSEV